LQQFFFLGVGEADRAGYPRVAGVDPATGKNIAVGHEHVVGIAHAEQYLALLPYHDQCGGIPWPH
jgi:hypothetical protein